MFWEHLNNFNQFIRGQIRKYDPVQVSRQVFDMNYNSIIIFFVEFLQKSTLFREESIARAWNVVISVFSVANAESPLEWLLVAAFAEFVMQRIDWNLAERIRIDWFSCIYFKRPLHVNFNYLFNSSNFNSNLIFSTRSFNKLSLISSVLYLL